MCWVNLFREDYNWVSEKDEKRRVELPNKSANCSIGGKGVCQPSEEGLAEAVAILVNATSNPLAPAQFQPANDKSVDWHPDPLDTFGAAAGLRQTRTSLWEFSVLGDIIVAGHPACLDQFPMIIIGISKVSSTGQLQLRFGITTQFCKTHRPLEVSFP